MGAARRLRNGHTYLKKETAPVIKFVPKNPVYIKSMEEDQEGNLIIKGFANRFQKDGQVIIDRGNDVIPPEEWLLKEFMENPIIFFQHNRNIPIGRALEIIVKDDGLFITVLISKSTDDETSRIRTLILEGILKAFSVGIDVREEDLGDNRENILKGVTLLEVSVVSMPMNQQSFFSISNKAWEATHKLCNFDRVLEEKGAWVAAAVHNRIFEMAAAAEDFDRNQTLMNIAESASVPMEELFEVLAGNMIDINIDILDAFSRHLNLQRDKLEELNDADVETQGTSFRPDADEEEEENDTDDDGGDNPEQQSENDQMPLEDGGQADNDDSELVDEENQGDDQTPGDSQEDSGTGDTPEDEDNTNDDDDEEEKSLLVDDDKEILIDEKQNVQTDTFRKCVAAKMREAVEAGKTEAQASEFALNACRDKSDKRVITSHEFNQMYIEAVDSIPLGEKNTNPFGTQVESDANFGGNQMLATANQTNILLGQVIAELQKLQQMAATQNQLQQFLNAAMQALGTNNPNPPNQGGLIDNGGLPPKHLDSIRKYQEKLMELLVTV